MKTDCISSPECYIVYSPTIYVSLLNNTHLKVHKHENLLAPIFDFQLFYSTSNKGVPIIPVTLQGTENPIYVFPEKELRGLSPNSYIHVSVSDLYIHHRISPHIWLQQKRHTDPENI
jgi:hypothetical protein